MNTILPLNLSFIDLLNSDKGTEDKLEDTSFINRFIPNKNIEINDKFQSSLISKLKNLRTIFKNIIEKVNDSSIDSLNKHISKYTITRKLVYSNTLKKYNFFLKTDNETVESIVAILAFSFAEIIDKGNLERIRICENPECSYYFYDTSKGNKKKWCNPKLCGNVMKVRNFRRRKKEKHK